MTQKYDSQIGLYHNLKLFSKYTARRIKNLHTSRKCLQSI